MSSSPGPSSDPDSYLCLRFTPNLDPNPHPYPNSDQVRHGVRLLACLAAPTALAVEEGRAPAAAEVNPSRT